jgi:hypothetical protein
MNQTQVAKPTVTYDRLQGFYKDRGQEIAIIEGVHGHPHLPDGSLVRTSLVAQKFWNPNVEGDLIGFETLNTLYMEAINHDA